MSAPSSFLFRLPFALLMGPQRSGTAWVDRYLRSRGDVCLPRDVKEVFYFDRNYKRGAKFYKSHFYPEPAHKIISEITATSFDCPEAPKRVYKHFGKDIRLICPLRHPVIRSYSLYLHYLRYGIATGSLEEAARQVPQILTSSHYATHLKRWFDLFGQENIKIIYQEELEKDEDGFIKSLCAGLGIPFQEPSKEAQGRYNITTFSKYGPLALMAQKFADLLRYYKLYAVINFAKKIGVKRLIFGKERPDAGKNNIPKEDLKFLQQHLGNEVQKLEELLGEPVKEWDHIRF